MTWWPWTYFTGNIIFQTPLQWRHNMPDGVSNHQPHECLLSRWFRRRSRKTSKLRVTGLCAGNSPVTGEFPAQRASNADNVSIWWRHHVSDKSYVNYFIPHATNANFLSSCCGVRISINSTVSFKRHSDGAANGNIKIISVNKSMYFERLWIGSCSAGC